MAGVLEVSGGEQHLPRDDVVPVEAVLIAVDEHVLTDGSSGLLRGEVGGAGIQVQIGHAGGDGPDETRTTSQPRPCASARAVTSGPIWPALSPLIDDEPTFTTMRLAVPM